MQDLIKRLLTELGEDPDREGLVKTPKRVDKALRFLTSGYSADIDGVLVGGASLQAPGFITIAKKSAARSGASKE